MSVTMTNRIGMNCNEHSIELSIRFGNLTKQMNSRDELNAHMIYNKVDIRKSGCQGQELHWERGRIQDFNKQKCGK